jgi:threonine/homoserine/homoserine lactone efflux protein
MTSEYLLKGLLIGFAIAAPVGPIGLLTIRRTLASGWASGFATGLGAATADAVYGAIAAFGLTAVSALLVEQQGVLRLLGGLFLIYLGVQTFRAVPAATPGGDARAAGITMAWGSAVLLTLTNPATILSFVAVFAGLGLAAAEAMSDAALMVAGVFLGSAAWWLILSSLVVRIRHRLAERHLRWINRGCGVLLICFGAGAVLASR